MKWTTAVSQNSHATLAFREACAQLELPKGAAADVLLVFFSDHHVDNARDLALAMTSDFPNAVAVGCNAEGVVGSADIGEAQPSLSVMVGHLPGVKVRPMRFEAERHDHHDFDWRGELQVADGDTPHFLILSQAEGFETEGLLTALDRAFPSAQLFGALTEASATTGTCLILEGHVYRSGAVGLAFSGNVRVDTVVAQTCRPIGQPLIVTEHTQNIIHQFNSGNPMEVFQRLVADLDPDDRKLAQHAMFVGIGVENKTGVYRPGDFVLRNLIGFNPKTGDLAIAAPIRDLDIIQFHLMDPQSIGTEFNRAMGNFAAKLDADAMPNGALLFSGISSAENRSDKALEESDILRDHFGCTPLGGFFSEGEIAPVGRTPCVHGFASTVVFFRSRF
ncbi:FIST signal transduction protein [Bradymonas sediminis]|nr:FIST N-terminal domain-containing protein [Bradymonas sediminis]TDP76541.1 small ligand-binding sensory domain FIST [Bradymonas sediminis]